MACPLSSAWADEGKGGGDGGVVGGEFWALVVVNVGRAMQRNGRTHGLARRGGTDTGTTISPHCARVLPARSASATEHQAASFYYDELEMWY